MIRSLIRLLVIFGLACAAFAQTAPATGQTVQVSDAVRARWGVLATLAGRYLMSVNATRSMVSHYRWEIVGERMIVEFRTGGIIYLEEIVWVPSQSKLKLSRTGNDPEMDAHSAWITEVTPTSFLERDTTGGYFARYELRNNALNITTTDILSGRETARTPNRRSLLAPSELASAYAQANVSPVPNTVLATTSATSTPEALKPGVPLSTVSAAGPRLALVIGNAAYTGELGRLANPANDSRLVAATLRGAGFQVIEVTNVDQKAMKRAIQNFGAQLRLAGKGATGLFYYAGHGVQSRGANYLVPVGAAIEAEGDVEIETVAADTVLRQMEDAGVATTIVILDACRNLPIQRAFRDGTRGLVRMEAPNGSFVAYSTAPGSLAADGAGANSPFAQAFASELAKPGQPIEIMFRNVRRLVQRATGGKQTPWDSSSLVDSFVFTP